MPIKQIDYGSEDYQQTIRLRSEILRKPLNLSFSEADLAKEKDDIHIAAFDEDVLLGCCLLTPVDQECVRLRQMAVQNNVQGKGIGAAMMRFAENVAADKGYSTIMMHARESAVGFYKKLGYAVSSEQFQEVSLPHYVMKKPLDVLNSRW